MKNQDPFNIEYQFGIYLEQTGLAGQELPPRLLRELKRAFFGGSAQTYMIMRDDLRQLPEEEAVGKMVDFSNQIFSFFESEAKSDENFEEKLRKRANLN
jgi:hypothetical protein